MGKAKLQKVGNSLGFRIPRKDLKTADFDKDSDYELIANKGVIFVIKKYSHPTEWVFSNTALTIDDRKWLESNLD